MTARDDDRIAYLAGDAADGLSANDRAELDELRELLHAPATWAEPDVGLEDRIVEAIAYEAGTRTTGAAQSAATPTAEPRPAASPPAGAEHAAPQTAPPASVEPRARPRRRSWFGLSFRRPALAFGGLAAAVAAVVVALVIASSSSSSPPPLHFAMVVSGTPLAPDAHGSAKLTKTNSGWRIELAATGLPHLANGRYYQAWLKNAAGILVPIGTFNDAVHVTLWSGVPVTQFRTLTVTQQLANGNANSSGKRVLVGRIVPAK